MTIEYEAIPTIIHDVNAEMKRAAKNNAELDLTNTTNDYIAYASAYMGRAAVNCERNERDGYDAAARRTLLVKAAGLLLQAAERS